MYAELAHDNYALKDLIEKKALRPPQKREVAEYLVAEHNPSKSNICAAVKQSRSSPYRRR